MFDFRPVGLLQHPYLCCQVYTVQFGVTKRVILSGYENMRDVLIKHADHTSLRTTQAMPKNHTEISNKTPGNKSLLLFSDFKGKRTPSTLKTSLYECDMISGILQIPAAYLIQFFGEVEG